MTFRYGETFLTRGAKFDVVRNSDIASHPAWRPWLIPPSSFVPTSGIGLSAVLRWALGLYRELLWRGPGTVSVNNREGLLELGKPDQQEAFLQNKLNKVAGLRRLGLASCASFAPQRAREAPHRK